MIAHLDCSTGVSGDKLLGALLELGTASGAFTADDLRALLGRLAPEAELAVERVSSHGVAATSVRVRANGQPHSRTWGSIRADLAGAAMQPAVHDLAVSVFLALAEAEAGVHGTAVDDVHFHEVGALDSILDVVGACAAFHALGIERLTASPVATGWGTVETSHGTLPVPAPATAALLLGIPMAPGPAGPAGGAPGELTTPTGAALVRVLVAEFGASPPMTPQAVGYGAGTRDIGHPNVCRVTLGAPARNDVALAAEQVALLETTIDHISAEAGAFAADQLLAEGALDVWQAPVAMKKGRLGYVLSVLVPAEVAEQFAGRVVALTGTLGVRRTDLPRLVAEREHREIATAYGPVRVKVGPLGATPRFRPEHDDVARVARETNRVYSAVAHELAELAGEELGGK